jgi:hypothetical protein
LLVVAVGEVEPQAVEEGQVDTEQMLAALDWLYRLQLITL